MVVGEGRAGKSTLVAAMQGKVFAGDSTIGIEGCEVYTSGVTAKGAAWLPCDLSGQQADRSTCSSLATPCTW